ncbi:7883_t:CDS:2, partial [Funneliformis geosporum]
KSPQKLLNDLAQIKQVSKSDLKAFLTQDHTSFSVLSVSTKHIESTDRISVTLSKNSAQSFYLDQPKKTKPVELPTTPKTKPDDCLQDAQNCVYFSFFNSKEKKLYTRFKDKVEANFEGTQGDQPVLFLTLTFNTTHDNYYAFTTNTDPNDASKYLAKSFHLRSLYTQHGFQAHNKAYRFFKNLYQYDQKPALLISKHKLDAQSGQHLPKNQKIFRHYDYHTAQTTYFYRTNEQLVGQAQKPYLNKKHFRLGTRTLNPLTLLTLATKHNKKEVYSLKKPKRPLNHDFQAFLITRLLLLCKSAEFCHLPLEQERVSKENGACDQLPYTHFQTKPVLRFTFLPEQASIIRAFIDKLDTYAEEYDLEESQDFYAYPIIHDQQHELTQQLETKYQLLIIKINELKTGQIGSEFSPSELELIAQALEISRFLEIIFKARKENQKPSPLNLVQGAKPLKLNPESIFNSMPQELQIKTRITEIESKTDKNGNPYVRLTLHGLVNRYFYAFSNSLKTETLTALTTTPYNFINRQVLITYQELPNQTNQGTFTGYPTYGIEIEGDSQDPVVLIQDFLTWDGIDVFQYKVKPQLIICNPPFNGYVLFAPAGFCANLTLESKRLAKFDNGTYPPIASRITLPKNIFEGVIFH